MTNEHRAYREPGKHFASHEAVSHGNKEYARGEATSNTVESSFAILKSGMDGTCHSVSEKHLQRFANEFDFRWNTRQSQGYSDSNRADVALKGIAGKRLTYRRIGETPAAVHQYHLSTPRHRQALGGRGTTSLRLGLRADRWTRALP